MAAVYFAVVISKATLIRRHATYERKAPALLGGLSSFIQNEEYLTSEEPLSVKWPHPNVLPGPQASLASRVREGYMIYIYKLFEVQKGLKPSPATATARTSWSPTLEELKKTSFRLELRGFASAFWSSKWHEMA